MGVEFGISHMFSPRENNMRLAIEHSHPEEGHIASAI